jgi:hypothetical protein
VARARKTCGRPAGLGSSGFERHRDSGVTHRLVVTAMRVVGGSTERHNYSCAKGWAVKARLPARSIHSALCLAYVTRHWWGGPLAGGTRYGYSKAST